MCSSYVGIRARDKENVKEEYKFFNFLYSVSYILESLCVFTIFFLPGIDGAVIVTTPQEVSLLDVRKELDFCRKVNLPIVGVIENMSGFVCPSCKFESVILPASSGGAEKMCSDNRIPLLGKVPLDPAVGQVIDFI